MNTTRQAWHIAKKDVRQFRWWLFGCAALTVVATLSALELWSSDGTKWSSLLGPALWLVGGVTAALMVQADAPADSRAFWASQALSAKSLLLSKVGSVFVLLLLPAAVGQWIALTHYGVRADHVVSLMLHSVWLYGATLLVAMMLAALTKRFTGLVGVAVGVPVAVMMLGVLLSGGPWQFEPLALPARLWGAIATLGAAALLVRTFNARSASRGWLASGALVGAVGLLAISRPTVLAAREAMVSTDAPQMQLDFDADAVQSLDTASEQYVLFSARNMVAPFRYSSFLDSATVTWSDDHTERLRVQHVLGEQPFAFGVADSASAGSAWLSTSKEHETHKDSRIARVRVYGSAEMLASQRLGLFDVAQSSQLRDGEIAIEVRAPKVARNGAAIKVTTVFADRTDIRDIMSMRRNYTIRLVWPTRPDTVELSLNATASEQRILVLPGASAHTVSMWRDVRTPRNLDTLPAPLTQAKLELLHWTPVARYPVLMQHVYR